MLRPALAIVSAVLLSAGSAEANKVFVSNERGNNITVLDSESWEVIATFPAGNRPRGITISPDGKELYVCASDDDTVRVFDPETYKELHTLPSGRIRSFSPSILRAIRSTSPMRTTIS